MSRFITIVRPFSHSERMAYVKTHIRVTKRGKAVRVRAHARGKKGQSVRGLYRYTGGSIALRESGVAFGHATKLVKFAGSPNRKPGKVS